MGIMARRRVAEREKNKKVGEVKPTAPMEPSLKPRQQPKARRLEKIPATLADRED